MKATQGRFNPLSNFVSHTDRSINTTTANCFVSRNDKTLLAHHDASHGLSIWSHHAYFRPYVGAGPTGLMMAAQFARFGINFRIIEQNSHPFEKTKAIAVQARTLKIYDQMGLIEKVLLKGLKFTRAV
ncbi:FAD-dependent monooxygenase [Segetibacter aerophilus]|uniref:FAD-binding domain-containing protein n=1 Tax=Segetibacter aerophilus TaxID=670293 RepID=A0A512B6F9_9BACT|nr:FAD-dependent monooxygenase [Segetibacter aerophilus]GEO07552.1 hypothetical protein SAE01_00480 [Segetibacter aerophilus]